jgi:hypothetical protein
MRLQLGYCRLARMFKNMMAGSSWSMAEEAGDPPHLVAGMDDKSPVLHSLGRSLKVRGQHRGTPFIL